MKGAAPWPARGLITAGALALTILVGGFGGWAVFGRISGAVVADASVVVAPGRQIVQHLFGGVVALVHVREGDLVRRGDPLIVLDPDRVNRKILALDGRLNALGAQQARLVAERDGLAELAPAPVPTASLAGQRHLFEARRETHLQAIRQQDQRGNQIRDQIAGIRAQQGAFGRQLDLIRDELRQQEALLSRGLAQSGRVLSLRREAARLSGALGELQAQIALSGERLEEIAIQKLQLQSQRRQEAASQLSDLETLVWDLSQQRSALAEERRNLTIRAPVSGVVYGQEVFAERSVIRPAQPLLYIVPQDRPVTVLARVRLLDVGHVRPGQSVQLRLSGAADDAAAPLAGRVSRLSADAIAGPGGGPAYFQARIELAGPAAARAATSGYLRPGTPLQAFIKTGERRPIAYLMQPLTEFFRKAFRET